MPKRKIQKVFFVNHPSIEPVYKFKVKGQINQIPWNTTDNHKRKFICRDGRYLDKKGNINSAKLFFWGEYEVGSVAEMTGLSEPKGLHFHLVPATWPVPLLTKAMNTDPYVFGNHFKHICCGIGNKSFIPGDIILFGHIEPSTTIMDLDTVFVVKEKVKVYSAPITQYYKAGIEPLMGKKEFFYRGYNYYENQKYFSFVPCLISKKCIGIPRPKIDLTSIGFYVKAAGWKITAAGIPFTSSIWTQILTSVEMANWELGLYFDDIK